MKPLLLDSVSPAAWPAHSTSHAYGIAAVQPLAARSAAAVLQSSTLTAAERVIAAELMGRGGACDALSMMVSSMARMVQAGRCSENRWTLG